ncbi:MAG: hypothetical protein JNJ89_19110 [Rubrivivax sp.]|nr:hypothetical protein [Rubrivivax sp.]
MAHTRRGDDLVARVVAWHNRHPLARRIGAAQVLSVGVVSFPFRVPPGHRSARAAARAAAHAAAGPGVGTIATATPADEALADTPAPPEGGSLRERAEARARARAEGSPAEELPPAASPGDGAAADRAARARGDTAPGRAPVPFLRRLFGGGGPKSAAASGRRGWRAAFDEDLLDPCAPQALAQFALRHGVEQRPGPPEAPAREVEAPRRLAGGGPIVRLWVHAAAIDLGARRVRVLVAPAGRPAVLGPRLVGRGRAGAAGAFFGAACVVAAALAWPALRWQSGMQRQQAAAAPGPALAASAAASSALLVQATSSPPVPPAPGAPASGAAPMPGAAGLGAAPPAPASVAAAPADVPAAAMPVASAALPPAVPVAASTATTAGPLVPAVPMAPARPAQATALAAEPASPAAPVVASAHPAPAPVQAQARPPKAPQRALTRLVPALDDSSRQAARALGELARADRARQLAERHRVPGGPGTSAPVPQGAGPAAATAGSVPAAARTAAAAAPASPPRVLPATAWAVSTRSLRTRFESEQMLAALRDAAYRGGHGSELKLEVLPSGEDWRAVGWPLASRAEAERLRDALAARGVKIEVVRF